MTRTPLSVRLATIAVAGALAIGYGIYTVTTEPSTPRSTATSTVTSTTTSTTGAASNDSVQGLIDEWASQGRGGVAVALAGHDEELTAGGGGQRRTRRRHRRAGLGVPGREPVEDVRRGDAAATRRRRDDRTR